MQNNNSHKTWTPPPLSNTPFERSDEHDAYYHGHIETGEARAAQAQPKSLLPEDGVAEARNLWDEVNAEFADDQDLPPGWESDWSPPRWCDFSSLMKDKRCMFS